jgi:tRNA nucleotidyltransferase (CCA-adding enzyme)
MEIIVSHTNADFDSLASMVAAGKIYPRAGLVFPGSINRNVREYLSLHGDILEITDIHSLDLVDTRSADRLADLAPVVERKGVEVFVIDHHPRARGDLKGTRDLSEAQGATTTILVKLLRKLEIAISPYEATLFALGIHEDTGSLTYAGTTYEDAEALAWLIGMGASPAAVSLFLHRVLSPSQHELMNQLLGSFHYHDFKGIQVVVATAEIGDYVEGVSVAVSRVVELENIDVFFALIKMQGRVQVIGHSRLADVKVDKILADLGGGGHAEAASAVVRQARLDQLEKDLLESVRKRVKPVFSATRIMTAHVRTIEEKTTISEASRRMEKTGHTAFPVVNGKGKLVGLISRKDLNRAGHHGLGHAPVKGFMSRNTITVKTDATIQEMQALMLENAIGRLPVIDNGKIVGIVTRKDLLRAMHGAAYLRAGKPALEASQTRSEMLELVQRSLPGEIRNILTRISHLAEEKGFNVFLVGGMVRDLLMGQCNYDMDVVVEGRGIVFARLLAKELEGRLRTHNKFGTAAIILQSGLRIDVASARTEYYPYPAALPQVETASIRQDLFRRDFSVNAMAVSLTGESYGELLDFFGGRRDLEKRQIRILHNLSFVEDPTRIFRAVRFEQRFSFTMEPQTEALARRAIEMEFVGELTGSRIREELVDILSEPCAVRAIKRLDEIGALGRLHPGLACDLRMERRFKRLDRHLPAFLSLQASVPLTDGASIAPPFLKWITYLAALLQGWDEDIEAWGVQMRLKRNDLGKLKDCLGMAKDLAVTIKKEGAAKPSRLHRLLAPLPAEARAYLYAQGGEAIRSVMAVYYGRIEEGGFALSGKDLEVMGLEPSHRYTRILNEVMEAVLDGEVKGRKAQLALAKRLVKVKDGMGKRIAKHATE